MHQIDLQVASQVTNLPQQEQIELWINTALSQTQEQCEIVVRIVDEAEITDLNKTYRKKNGPTNVLSFPFDSEVELPINLLGDIVICAPIVFTEAEQQNKNPQAHWAHLIIHGVLHLLGYDHLKEKDAKEMESLEINLLARLGYSNPYEEDVIDNE